MGERKGLNKYYPADFYPAKIPQWRRPENNRMDVRTMLPMNIRCGTCGALLNKKTKFNVYKEDVVGETYLGIKIFRFYCKCSRCCAEIILRTNPQNSDYVIESGASRNFEPRRAEEEEIEEEKKKKRKAEEMGDSLKLMENRTLESKREIDIIAALEELKSMKSRREKVGADALLEALHQRKEKKLREEDEEEEAYIRAVLGERKNRKIDDDDDDDDLERSSPTLKRSKAPYVLKRRRGFYIMKKSSTATATAKDKKEKDGLQSLIQHYTETTK